MTDQRHAALSSSNPAVDEETLQPSRATIETFPNPSPGRDYVIETICPEFTSMCPKTGHPDFGTIVITYVPDELCFELKSLKLYLQQYRMHGAFYEAVTNTILDDLVAVTQPKRMRLVAEWTPRGGIRSNYAVEFPPREMGVDEPIGWRPRA